jgi:cellulose synthase operon protein C
MARQRINTRFLLILTGIVVGSVGAVYLAQKLLIHPHADTYIAKGKEAMREQNWLDAVVDFNTASQLDPRNADTQMLLGAALHQEAMTDADKFALEVKAYQQALQIDPNSLPALDALIKVYQEIVQRPNAPSFAYRQLIEYAQRAHELEPDNTTMAALPSELVIQEWISGLQVDSSDISKALSDLRALMQKNPGDADLPFNIAKAKIQQAQQLSRQAVTASQPPEVTALYQEAVDIFKTGIQDVGGQSQDSNPLMHYRFGQTLEFLSQMDESDPGNPAKYLAQAFAETDRARALVKPKDSAYLAIYENAAEMDQRHGDTPGAIRIYRSLPQEPGVQLELASLLGTSNDTRPEGERMLEKILADLNDDPNHIASGSLRYFVMFELADLRITDFQVASDPQIKSNLKDQIQAAVDQLVDSVGSKVPIELMRLQSRYQLVTGQSIAVIEALSPVMANDPQGAGSDQTLQIYLAQAYANSGQSGRAISLVRQVVQQNPENIGAHKFLAKLLVHESPDEASGELEKLDEAQPNDPELLQMHLDLLLAGDVDHNRAEIKKYYVQLKEETPEQIGQKARVAMRTKDWDESIRLLDKLIAATPKDAGAFSNLSMIYLYQGKRDQALDVATRGLAANPGDPQLSLLIPSIKGEDAKTIEHIQEHLVEQIADPVERELQLAAIAQKRRDMQSEEQHLKAAETAAPDSARVANELFTFYLDQGRPDDAAKYVPKLAAANYDRANGDVCRYLLARAHGDNDQALEIAEHLTQDKPEFDFSWLLLGQILQAQGHYDQAEIQYVSALQRRSTNVDAYKGLIECSYVQNKRDDALRYIQDGLSKMPDNPDLREMMVAYQLNFGNPQDAIAALQEEINRSPNTPALYSALGGLYIRVARTLDASQRHADAIRLLQNAVNFMEGAIQRFPDEGMLYESLAEAAVAAGQPKDAENELLAWSQRDAWRLRPEPHVRLAELYDLVGQPEAAESQMHTALARSDYRLDLQLQMADMLSKHGKFDEAIELLRATNADKPEVGEKIIQVLSAAGRDKEAQAQLQTDLAQNPPDASRLLALWARILTVHAQWSDAIDRATQALALEPASGMALSCRAWARLHATPPDPNGALADLKLLHEAVPDNPQIRLEMVDAYMLLDQTDEAATELQAALRVDPMNKPARMRLVQIFSSGEHPQFSEALRLLQNVDSTPPFDKDPDVFQAEAVVFGDTNDLPDAIQASEKAISFSPANPELLRTHLDLLIKAAEYQEVLDTAAALPQGVNNSWWAFLDRGIAENHLGDSASASTDMNNALKVAATSENSAAINHAVQAIAQEFGGEKAIAAIKPYTDADEATRMPLVMLYHIKGDDASAAAILDSVIADVDKLNRADQIAAFAMAGQIYQTVEPDPMADKALDAYRRWLKLEPDNMQALNNIACLLADAYTPTRAQEGLPYIQKAADYMNQTGNTDPNVLDTQGWLLILSGDPAQGVGLVNQAIEAQPGAESYYHLAEGYFLLQYASEANKDAQTGLDLLDKQTTPDKEVKLRTKLKDLIARSEELMKSKQQAQVP